MTYTDIGAIMKATKKDNMCMEYTKSKPPRVAALGGFLGYLSDLSWPFSHLLTQSPTKRAATATKKDNMYCIEYTSFLAEVPTTI